MKRMSVVFVMVLLAQVLPVTAGEWWVPAAAHANGAQGSVWRTDLVIHNFGTSDQLVEIVLVPQDADNAALAQVETMTVAAGATEVVEDVVDGLFAYSGTAAFKIDAPGDELMITSRTYNLGDGGTFGQSIPAVAAAAISDGTGYGLLGLSGTDGRRTNLGWVTLSDEPVDVTVELYSGDGLRLATRTFSGSFTYWQNQVELFSALGVQPVAEGYAVVWSEGRIVPYGSVVAAGSNDPIYIAPMAALEASTTLMFPAVAHVAGAGGTSWRTDAWILNMGSQAAEVTLELWPQNGGAVRGVVLDEPLMPGDQVAVEDLVFSAFGFDNAQGALLISSEVRLLATSRTYNTADTGTFGQFIPAQSQWSLANIGEKTVLGSVVWNADFRSNIGVVTTGSNSRVGFVLRDDEGEEVATSSRNLGRGEQRQIKLTDLFNIGSVAAGSIVEVTLEASDGEGQIAAYVSVVDNGSTDPTYAEAYRTLGAPVDPEIVASVVLSSAYALSTAIDQTGPQAFGKTEVDCLDVEYDGDTVLPGQSVEGKCWYAGITFSSCEWLFPNIGWRVAQGGTASADVCIVDGHENVFSADLTTTIEDLNTGEQFESSLEGVLAIIMEFNNSLPESTTLVGDMALSINGEAIEATVDLTWEGALVGLEFIPHGVLALRFPYETDMGRTTAEVVSTFDGTDWIFVEARIGYWNVKFYLNIFTGEVRLV